MEVFLTVVLRHHHRVQARLCPAIVARVTRRQDNPLQSVVLSTARSWRHIGMKCKETGQAVEKTQSQEHQISFLVHLLLPPSSHPLHLDYFSCLIGLSAEDVPGVCQGEIAVVSKRPSVLARMT